MAGQQPSFKDPSSLHAPLSRPLQNPPPSLPPPTTHLLHCRFSAPTPTFFQVLHPSQSAQEYAPAERPSSSSPPVSSSFLKEELQEGVQDEHQYDREEEEEWVEGDGSAFQHRGRGRRSGRVKRSRSHVLAESHLPVAPRSTYTNPLGDSLFCPGRTLERQRAAFDEDAPEVSVDEGMHTEASDDEGSHSNGGQQLQAGSEHGSQYSEDSGSSSAKDTIDPMAVHTGEKGQVSPLRALSHIAHIKRKQDCLQMDSKQMQPDVPDELAFSFVHGSSSKRKKLKRVQFQLEPLTYQKLMRILSEEHEGSFERFIISSLDSISLQDNSTMRAATTSKKPAFAKWKRTRFDQLKGTETEELALAFRSLAKSTSNVEVTADLMNIPWQELNMLQLQKMLEETKRMLLVLEKVHDCPFPDCDRRFSTPGSLKDHLNEHSGEQPYRCSFEDCPHRFRSKQHLCRHMKKHERAHICTFEGCNKRFAFRERLIVHQKIHSDERPLSCPWEGCGKTFKWANSLHGHMRTHTGEKPFQCTFAGCGRLFGYKVDLTRHRRTHFGQPARANH